MRKIALYGLMFLLISGCSVATNNVSKGSCRNIPACKGSGCKAVSDTMTQSNCRMVGGTFIPVNHKQSWLKF